MLLMREGKIQLWRQIEKTVRHLRTRLQKVKITVCRNLQNPNTNAMHRLETYVTSRIVIRSSVTQEKKNIVECFTNFSSLFKEWLRLEWTSGDCLSQSPVSPQNWTQHSRCISPVVRRGQGSHPLSCWQRSSSHSPGHHWSSLLQG